jgi:hypothetical protein
MTPNDFQIVMTIIDRGGVMQLLDELVANNVSSQKISHITCSCQQLMA